MDSAGDFLIMVQITAGAMVLVGAIQIMVGVILVIIGAMVITITIPIILAEEDLLMATEEMAADTHKTKIILIEIQTIQILEEVQTVVILEMNPLIQPEIIHKTMPQDQELAPIQTAIEVKIIQTLELTRQILIITTAVAILDRLQTAITIAVDHLEAGVTAAVEGRLVVEVMVEAEDRLVEVEEDNLFYL